MYEDLKSLINGTWLTMTTGFTHTQTLCLTQTLAMFLGICVSALPCSEPISEDKYGQNHKTAVYLLFVSFLLRLSQMHLEDIQLCHLEEKTGPDVSQRDILWSCFLFLSVVCYYSDVLNRTEKDFHQEWHAYLAKGPWTTTTTTKTI